MPKREQLTASNTQGRSGLSRRAVLANGALVGAGIWTSVASARRHSRRTKETAPLSPRGQSKQPNATTSPDTAFELSRRRQIPPFAAVYTREPSGVRQRSVGGDPLRKKCSDRVRR